MGAHTQPTVPVSVVSMRKTGLKSLVSAPLRKAEREVIPSNQNFAQLTKKIEKVEKALKKSGKKGKKRHYEDSNSDSK
jgi:hypothetical protein